MIKVYFVDFWPDFNPQDNYFYHLLSKNYTVSLDNDPDILFYSSFGIEHLKYTCKKLFYTGENIKPDYDECDYSISFEDQSRRNLFFPHFCEFDHFFDFKEGSLHQDAKQYQDNKKTKFCSFMASNAKATERIEFVKKLMQYKKVDCSGPVLYNMEEKDVIGKIDVSGKVIDWRKEKLEVIQHYKFTIAFENECENNYVTEKIFQPLLVKSIPIYWGAPNIGEYFNPQAFINVQDYSSFEDAIDEIKRIDQDEMLYKEYIKAKPILKNSKIHPLSEQSILNWFDNVLKADIELVAKKRKLALISKYYLLYNLLLAKKLIKQILQKLKQK